MLFHVSAVRPQLSALSHGDLLTLSFTSPFIETGHIREFARLLTSTGVAVTVAAARVTETELGEANTNRNWPREAEPDEADERSASARSASKAPGAAARCAPRPSPVRRR